MAHKMECHLKWNVIKNGISLKFKFYSFHIFPYKGFMYELWTWILKCSMSPCSSGCSITRCLAKAFLSSFFFTSSSCLRVLKNPWSLHSTITNKCIVYHRKHFIFAEHIGLCSTETLRQWFVFSKGFDLCLDLVIKFLALSDQLGIQYHS